MKYKIKAPIKYYGGKSGFMSEILKYFPVELSYNTFIDAFGGSGAVLLSKPPFGVEIYNDLNRNVYSLYKVLADKDLFPKFKEQCDLALYSEDLRKEFKLDLKNKEMDTVERAFKFFYVNRTSHNGVGGFSLNSHIRRGMSKATSDFLSAIDRLKDLHDRLSRVIVTNRDAVEMIPEFDRDGVFVYADSPYAHVTRGSARYETDMDNEHQEKYITMLIGIKKAKILVSGYNCPLYENLVASGWEMVSFDVNTIDGKRNPKTKKEFLWMNY